MNEALLLEILDGLLKDLKEIPDNPKSAPLFKKVISNNAPIWTEVASTPSVCFYLADTTYDDMDRLRFHGTSIIKIYVYNKHKTRGLSLPDILSPLINVIKAEVQKLPDLEAPILNAFITSVKRDGGTVLPYTIAELTLEVEFAERKTC